MAYHEPRKEFSAERQLKIRRLGRENGVGNAELLHAIQELREEVAGLRQAQISQTVELDEDHPAFTESLEVRVEIAQMVRMIGRAKLEIASIKHPMAENDDRMKLAASELDAIVLATEASTQDILAASERMETLVRTITGLHPNDEEMTTLGDQMANEIIKTFEACSFQDITGQRINKVIKTIRFIEEKILAMINIWGAEAFIDLPVASDPSASGDDSLMNGPQLQNQGITQDEINALFD
ncbi:MAG: protein phosphatase CheZ [Proteobacteria bacterium]|nr:protein phosphatase CheZ [Pseudomonadota bacterium]